MHKVDVLVEDFVRHAIVSVTPPASQHNSFTHETDSYLMSSTPQKFHSCTAVADQAETSAAQQQRLRVLDEYRLTGI